MTFLDALPWIAIGIVGALLLVESNHAAYRRWLARRQRERRR